MSATSLGMTSNSNCTNNNFVCANLTDGAIISTQAQKVSNISQFGALKLKRQEFPYTGRRWIVSPKMST